MMQDANPSRPDRPSWPVRHNPDQSRFEVAAGGETAVAEYRLHGGVLQLTHTAVPVALEGRGIASALVAAALAHARAQHLKVEPRCSYAAAYICRHPQAQDLLV